MSKSEDSKDYLSKMQSYESYRITAIGKKACQTIKPKTDSRFGDKRVEV